MANTKCSQLPIVEFQHVDRMVRSTRLHQGAGTTFSPECGKKAGLVLQPVMQPLTRLKCLSQVDLGGEAARLKPHLVLIVCWCGGMGTKPKVGERQADASEGQQSGKDQRGQTRAQARDLESPGPRQKSPSGWGRDRDVEKKCPIRIWQCGRNKEVGRFRASSNG